MRLRRLDRLALATLALALLGGAGGPPRAYKNEPLHVRGFEAPPGWEMAPQSSYPRLLVSYSHPDGGKLTLSAQRVPRGTTAHALAEQARAPLAKQGWQSARVRDEAGRARLDAEADAGRRILRQAYVVEAGIGYVVTMIAPAQSGSDRSGDFEEALKSLKLGGAEPTADTTPQR